MLTGHLCVLRLAENTRHVGCCVNQTTHKSGGKGIAPTPLRPDEKDGEIPMFGRQGIGLEPLCPNREREIQNSPKAQCKGSRRVPLR